MVREYDAAVIGAGPGGYVAAIRLGQLGKKTVVIEDTFIGGVCLNIGCIPSKAVISASKEHKHAKEGGRGIQYTGVKVDMKKLVDWKQSVVDKLTGGVSQLLKANGVDTIQGRGRLTGKDTIEVDTGEGKETVKARDVIIATGSRTIEIPGFRFDEKRVLSSTGALELKEVPKHLVVIGGGVIGLELGCAYRNLGSKVTVIEMMAQLIPGTDHEVAKALERILKKNGFDIHLEAKAKEAKVSKTGVKVSFEPKGGKAETLEADYVLVSVGRRPNSQDIGLEKAGVKTDDRGFILTDDRKRTNVKGIYAIGDVTRGPMLAHKASKEGIVAAEAISGDKGAAADWATVPGVIFTDPEVATAGLTEEQAREQGHEVRIGKFNVGALGKAMAELETDGFYKVIGDAKTDRLLGLHIIGPHASDLIAEAALALEMGATVEDIALTIHPHPTLNEGIMEAAEAAHGKSIHMVNRPAKKEAPKKA